MNVYDLQDPLVGLPMVTPFSLNGELDLDAADFNLDKWKKTGVDIFIIGTASGEELLMSEEMLKQVWLLRRMLSMANSTSDGNSHEVIENLFSRLYKSKDNEEFLTNLGRELVK